MNELFQTPEHSRPLADLLRPRNLEDFFGQEHLTAPNALFRRCIDSDSFHSLILFGPPGTGKTTLARIIAQHSKSHFISLSALELSVSELKKIMREAEDELKFNGKRSLVFIDEIHRFNKSQQDTLLKDIESGNIRFIGATTHNPNFYVTAALGSRSLFFELKSHGDATLIQLLHRGMLQLNKGRKQVLSINEASLKFLAANSEGDARRALNTLELAANTSTDDQTELLETDLRQCLEAKGLVYAADDHYDCASAFIKSMRGSDADAAIYWLARMLVSGEDIRFIARRLMIFAAEDIGNADPRALQLCTSAAQSSEMVGMPEARIILGQATTYCATAPKSNASYAAINAAIADVKNKRSQAVPAHLRDTHSSKGRKGDYQYPHDNKDGFVKQEYLGVDTQYYHPVERGYEVRIKERMDYWAKMRGNDHEQS